MDDDEKKQTVKVHGGQVGVSSDNLRENRTILSTNIVITEVDGL